MVDWDKVVDLIIILYLIRMIGRDSEATCEPVASSTPSGSNTVSVYISGIPVARTVPSSVDVNVSSVPIASSIETNTYISVEEYTGK